MGVRDLVRRSLSEFIIHLSWFISQLNDLSDAELKGRLDKLEELDEFEPDEVHGGLVFSEDEDILDPEEKDDW